MLLSYFKTLFLFQNEAENDDRLNSGCSLKIRNSNYRQL